jgi:hypothetical protein
MSGRSGFINVSISRGNHEKAFSNRTEDPKDEQLRVSEAALLSGAGAGVAVINPSGVSVKRQSHTEAPNPEGVGDRGTIKGRSTKSRKRLMELLSRIELEPLVAERPKARYARALFVTLTYPKDFPGWERAKRDLDVFKKRLCYHYPFKWGVWVEEYQKRGAVHFHIIMVFDRSIDVYTFRNWLSNAWYEVVESGDPLHLKAGTQAVPLHAKKGVGSLMGYLAGEMGKVKQTRPVDPETGELIETGRTWAPWYKDKMPLQTLAVVVFETREAWYWFKRNVGRYYHSKDPRSWLAHVHQYVSWGGALLYGDGRFLFKKLIQGIPGVSLRDPMGA